MFVDVGGRNQESFQGAIRLLIPEFLCLPFSLTPPEPGGGRRDFVFAQGAGFDRALWDR